MILALVILWIVFSGYFELYFLGAGLVSLLMTLIITKKFFGQSNSDLLVCGFKLNWLYFFAKLLKEITISSFAVSKIIWSRNIEIESEESYVDCLNLSDNKKVIYANSITLTPGTMTLQLEKDRIFVHTLDKSFMQDLKNGDLMKIVEKIS